MTRSKYSKLNTALAEVNDVLPCYFFQEFHRYNSENIDGTMTDLTEIKEACENALKELNALKAEGEKGNERARFKRTNKRRT